MSFKNQIIQPNNYDLVKQTSESSFLSDLSGPRNVTSLKSFLIGICYMRHRQIFDQSLISITDEIFILLI